MASRRLASADFVTGLVLAVAGIAILVISIDMPRFEERGVNPWTVPGIMPGAVGAVLAILASVLVIRSFRGLANRNQPAPPIARAQTPAEIERPTGVTAVVFAAVTGGGFVLLLGSAPFGLLTFVFLMVFMLTFEFRHLRGDSRPWRRLAVITGAAAAVALVVPYIFETLFLVRLP